MNLLARILASVYYPEDGSGCWVWFGPLKGRGYGQMTLAGRNRSVHRVVYELLVGPIPADRELDHLCRNKACCNPAHLEVVTHRENVLRGNSFAALNAAATHCKHGHALTAANTYSPPNRPTMRQCRACSRRRGRELSARRSA